MLSPDPSRGVGRFESSLRFEEVLPAPPNAGPNYVRIRLTAPLIYMTNAGRRITVPAGFECDGASIPPVAAAIVGAPLSAWNAAAGVVHDFAYRSGQWSKDAADELLYDAVRCAGATGLHAATLWKAVNDFGQSAYDENARKRSACRLPDRTLDLPKLMAWA